MNVVIVVVDALRADHLTPYGYSLNTSPFLSKLAGQGAYYDNAYAQAPWTNSSIASMFTGLDPTTHKVISIEGEKVESLVPDSLNQNALTMAEVFKTSGYDTFLVSANPWFIKQGGLPQGFDGLNLYMPDTLSSQINGEAIKLLKDGQSADKPFFLYIHYMDLHGVYRNPPEPYRHMFIDEYNGMAARILTDEEKEKYGYISKNLPTSDLREYLVRYDRSIRFVDAQLEWLWNELGVAGLKGNTIFIVTADHGEAFLDHGVTEHGTGLHQEQIWVPLFIWRPGMIRPGKRSDVVQLEDIFPTFVEMIGLDVPESFETDRTSFAYSLLSGRSDKTRTAWSENHIRDLNQVVFIRNGMKWFYDLDSEEIVEIYNLRADPGERDNLLDKMEPEKIRKITKYIRSRLAADNKKASRLGMGGGTVNLPDDTRENLKALGYIE